MHSIETRTVRRAWLVLAGAAVAAGLLGPSAASALPSFRIVVTCGPTNVVVVDEPTPVNAGTVCDGEPFGRFVSGAIAEPGGVGVAATARSVS